MIIKILTLGVLLYAGLKLINLVFRKMSFTKRVKRHLEYIMDFAELLIVLAFISWIVILAYRHDNNFMLFFLGLLFVLLIVPSFILVRDLIFGIFLKSQNKLPLNSKVNIGAFKGRIVKTGRFFLGLEDNQGNIKSISYYSLRSKVISAVGDNYELEKLNLEFDLPYTSRVNELGATLKKQLLSTPWVAVSKPIQIEGVVKVNDRMKVKVGLFTLSKSFEENIRTVIEALHS